MSVPTNAATSVGAGSSAQTSPSTSRQSILCPEEGMTHDSDKLIVVDTWEKGLSTKAISNYIFKPKPKEDIPESKEAVGDVTVYDFSRGAH